jgi:hypothetical protein
MRANMFWKFWTKKPSNEPPKPPKLPRPKDLPDPVGREMVVRLGKNPDWVWHLKCVLRPRPEGKKCYDFRVFSQQDAAENRINVKNYLTLDEHPELILFQGWYDKVSMRVVFEDIPTPRKLKAA